MGCAKLKYQNFSFLEVIHSEKSAPEEKKRINYYPFGLKHKGYNTNIISEHKWKYNGKELQDELDLNWYDLGARNLDHALGRFMNVDPKAEQYNFQSPYAFANNNPVLFVDINGEGVDWKPQVDEQGNTSYVAEQGDSAETLSQQYGISQEDAEQITDTTGDTKIEEGTEVSGETVAEVTGSEVLKLDLNSDMATESRVIQQFVFANDYTSSQGGDGWYATSFYGGVFDRLQTDYTYQGNIQLGGGTVEARLTMQWYTSQGSYFNTTLHSAYVSTGLHYSEDRVGKYSGKTQEITHMRFPRGFAVYNPPRFRTNDGLPFTVKRNQRNKLINHFNRK